MTSIKRSTASEAAISGKTSIHNEGDGTSTPTCREGAAKSVLADKASAMTAKTKPQLKRFTMCFVCMANIPLLPLQTIQKAFVSSTNRRTPYPVAPLGESGLLSLWLQTIEAMSRCAHGYPSVK